jgi:hypothetical protein
MAALDERSEPGGEQRGSRGSSHRRRRRLRGRRSRGRQCGPAVPAAPNSSSAWKQADGRLDHQTEHGARVSPPGMSRRDVVPSSNTPAAAPIRGLGAGLRHTSFAIRPRATVPHADHRRRPASPLFAGLAPPSWISSPGRHRPSSQPPANSPSRVAGAVRGPLGKIEVVKLIDGVGARSAGACRHDLRRGAARARYALSGDTARPTVARRASIRATTTRSPRRPRSPRWVRSRANVSAVSGDRGGAAKPRVRDRHRWD